MRRFVCAVGVVLAAGSVAAQSAPHLVTIRIYNTLGLQRSELDITRAIVNRIFGDAGVRITWRECRTPRGPSAASRDACGDVLRPMELMLRLLTSPSSDAESITTFGYSLVDTKTHTGVLATVYPDRTTETARRLLLNAGDLLGLAVAHEIGHLLLGTPAHTSEGLMRAHWPDALLRPDAGRSWRFSREETADILATLRPQGAPAKEQVVASVEPAAITAKVIGVE